MVGWSHFIHPIDWKTALSSLSLVEEEGCSTCLAKNKKMFIWVFNKHKDLNSLEGADKENIPAKGKTDNIEGVNLASPESHNVILVYIIGQNKSPTHQPPLNIGIWLHLRIKEWTSLLQLGMEFEF